VAGYLGRLDSSYFDNISETIHMAGLGQKFKYHGEISRTEKVSFLHGVDLVAVPTEYREAKGHYVLESMAAGTPVVVPNHGSFPELIDATGGGLLHEPGSESDLIEKILMLADNDDLRRSLGRSGMAAVGDGFTDVAMADRCWSLYESIVAGFAPGASVGDSPAC
jgi:glycosyltransferase involved in cell wall biosynthesis